MDPRARAIHLVLLFLGAGLLSAPAAWAQYFGSNKVQYETFDFRVLKTDHFDIYYYPEAEEAIQDAAKLAERWHTRLTQIFDHQLRGRQPLILYASHPHFRQTNAIPGFVGEGTGGVTEMFRRRVVMPLAGSLEATDHVLGHELVHAFQFDMTGEAHGGVAGVPTALRLPLWFIEGMAEYLSLGPVDPHTTMWMRDAALREELPHVRRLDHPRYFPYRYGHMFWAYVGGRWGDEMVGQVLKAVGPRGDAFTALQEMLGLDMDELTSDWHAAIMADFEPVSRDRRVAADEARPVVTRETAGEMNIGPSLSPDGRRVMFISERDLFSLNVFLADMETGEVVRRVVRTETDPHFDSLQFINSAGAFHPDGDRIVIAAVSRGQPVLSFIQVDTGRRYHEVRLRELGEIFNPHWSPDGRYIAFTAITGGLSDLYVYDLEAESLQRLTNDRFAYQEPAWSPDGRRIVVSTDRFTTDLELLQAGPLGLALVDPATGRVEALAGFEGAKHISPAWSGDGRSVYFLSNRGGITNVYRLDVASRNISQLTDLITGASGITATSPALSAALSADRIAFSVYEREQYSIYAIDTADRLAGRPIVEMPGVAAAVLPPRERGAGPIFAALTQPQLGFVPAPVLDVEDYRARLGLDFVGQPTIAVGADRFGSFVGGGISFLFGDMLGDHQLVTAIQSEGQFRDLGDIGGVVAYQNRRQRMNWGGGVEQIPFVTGTMAQAIGEVGGQPALVEQIFRIRQINRGVIGMTSYPFSRAQRVEASGGLRSISFDQRLDIRAFSLATGRLITEERIDLPSPDAINFGEVSGALVYDTSLFGATGPIVGRRYRFEAGQTAGGLRFTTALADYREYLMPVRPFTIAMRGLHYGRYGADGEDPRLSPLFIGFPQFVRGYDFGSFVPGEGALLQQLLGSRVMVGNLEVRFPLFGIFGGRSFYGPLPIELAVFSDAGVAWNSGDSPTFLGGDRPPMRSVGMTARMNLFGFAVVGVNYVNPIDRPQRGWFWQFHIHPAF